MLWNSQRDLKLPAANVKAVAGVYAYVDVVRLWLRRPLSRREWTWVNGQVGAKLLGYPFNIHCGGRQRLILTQPSEACLRFFVERGDASINHAEIALDIITPFATQLKQAVSVGFIQPRHGKRQGTIFPNDNFRTADLGCRGLSFQGYDDRPCKVTGETDCFHLEAKINGVRALHQLGIDKLSDLLAFDHSRFWQAHFHCRQINMARLARYHCNRRDGKKRRAPLIQRSDSGFAFNVDAAVGNVLWRVFASDNGRRYSLQHFVKSYGRHCRAPSYVIACTCTDSLSASMLHALGVIPAPDLQLLTPELCFPPRGHGRQLP